MLAIHFMTVLIPGDHEVVTTEPPDLRSLKFTHIKQRGTFSDLRAERSRSRSEVLRGRDRHGRGSVDFRSVKRVRWREIVNRHSYNIDTVLKVLVALVVLAGGAEAATPTVGPTGCDYTSIQDAVNAASEYGTIIVNDGTYTENVNVTRVATATDNLPEGMVLIDSSIPFASYENETVVWNLAEIGPFETVKIEYMAEALWSGKFVNSVEVDARSVDGPVGTECVVEVGEFEGERPRPGWQPPDWGFVSVCDENCELTP
jgi:hypothetical protein